jgi:hypothetical protein
MSGTFKAKPAPIEDRKAQGHQVPSLHSSSELMSVYA